MLAGQVRLRCEVTTLAAIRAMTISHGIRSFKIDTLHGAKGPRSRLKPISLDAVTASSTEYLRLTGTELAAETKQHGSRTIDTSIQPLTEQNERLRLDFG
jgi:hypothetical protein